MSICPVARSTHLKPVGVTWKCGKKDGRIERHTEEGEVRTSVTGPGTMVRIPDRSVRVLDRAA